MTVVCDYCNRGVPIAPGRFQVSVSHVRFRSPSGSRPEYETCPGNTKRIWLDVEHVSRRIALQHVVFQDDSMWDLQEAL